jgi:DDB1- and CUL4-associated factor 11
MIAQRTRILRILAGTNIGRLFMRSLDDDDGNEFVRFGRLRRTPLNPSRFPKVPSDKGIDLMHSGNFGTNKIQSTNAEKELARRILDRELGTDSGPRQKVTQGLMTQVSLFLDQY